MNLKTKKKLAARVLGVGKNKIHFAHEGLDEIKEAITKQDILTLHSEGIISIKPSKGRKKVEKRNRKRGAGKIKKKIKMRKQDYVKITRKLRAYLKKLKRQNLISRELYQDIRKKIKMKYFKSRAGLKEYIDNINKTKSEKKTEIIEREKEIKEEKKPKKTKKKMKEEIK